MQSIQILNLSDILDNINQKHFVKINCKGYNMGKLIKESNKIQCIPSDTFDGFMLIDIIDNMITPFGSIEIKRIAI